MSLLIGRLKKEKTTIVLSSIIICVFIIFWTFDLTKTNCDTLNDNDLLLKLSSCLQYQTNNELIHIEEATSILNNRDTKRDAIFFTETTGDGIIKGRFVCALESAARAYPNADIYLLIAYYKTFRNDLNEPLQMVLKHYPNVQVLKVDFKILFKGCVLESLYESKKMERSKYRGPHTSDILRFFAVWKYGGAYMDLDVITVRNLTGIKNYVITELDAPNCYLASTFFAFEKNFSMGPIMFKDMSENFDGSDWYANGPAIWTKTMNIFANVSNVGELNESNLKQFTKLNYYDLFPINYDKLDWYFDEQRAGDVLKIIQERKSLFGIHIGNNIAKGDKVTIGSHQAYSFLAQTYCPRSYWSCYDQF